MAEVDLFPAAVADRLAAYNRWSRGDDVEMPAPADLGRDIDAEIMVALESLVLGVAFANERLFGVSRQTSVERLEVMIERVEKRLVASGARPA